MISLTLRLPALHRIGAMLLMALFAFALAPQQAAAQRTNDRAKNHQVSADITRAVTTAYNRLSAREKQALSESLWGLWVAIEDESPAPFLHLSPPGEVKACVACGGFQGYPDDPCDGLRDELDELMERAILLGVVRDALQSIKQAFVDAEFYGGVAQLIADVVSTTVTVATAGTGAAFSRAAAKALAGIAVDQVKGSIMDALVGALPEPLASTVDGSLSEAAVDQLLGAMNKQVVAANNAKTAKILELQKCQKGYTQTLQDIEAANQKAWQCREANWGRFCANN
ncbi:MAG: hypothetical protein RhofKO_16820 [Rhodothermales bacterium]